MNETIELMMRHRSIRRFTDAEVPAEDLRQAVAAGQMASTSAAVQAYCCLHVRNRATREKLAVLAGNQKQVANCGAFLVICADTRLHRLLAARAGEPYDARLEAYLVAVIDASLFAQNLALALEAQGYGICYIGGLRNELRAVDQLLELPHGTYPLFGLCVGMPAQDPSPRPRLPVEAVLFEDRCPDDDVLLTRLAEYDDAYRRYLEARGAAAQGWTEAMAGRYRTPQRTDLAPFYADKGAMLR